MLAWLSAWGADLHIAQQMPPPLTISCSNKSRLVLTFLVLRFWYLLTRVDPDIFQTSSKMVVCVCVGHITALASEMAYCYSWSKMNCRLVCWSQPLALKNSRSDQGVIWDSKSGESKELHIRQGAHWILLKDLRATVMGEQCKMAELTKMPLEGDWLVWALRTLY